VTGKAHLRGGCGEPRTRGGWLTATHADVHLSGHACRRWPVQRRVVRRRWRGPRAPAAMSARTLRTDDPRAVGPFRVLARLGSGGMGAVYLARSPGGRLVAVKVVHPHLAHDDGFRTRFRREVAAARRVGGFWTAAVVDADPDAPMPWLATEYVTGPTLDEAVTGAGPLPDPTLRRLGAGLAEALVAIHATGLVHRDLKPSNVLLAADGPRLIDFGIARALEQTSLTAAGTVFGTPGYAAPEQVTSGAVGPASDVFALGGVLVFAATGHGPFGTGTPVELLRRAIAGRASADGCPDWLRSLAIACLSTDPASRPRPEQILAATGPAAGAGGPGWLPAPVQTMIATREADLPGTPVPGRPPTRPYTRLEDGHPGEHDERGAPPPAPARDTPPHPAPRPAPSGTAPPAGPAGATFTASRTWAALRGALCLLGVLLGGQLAEAGPAQQAIGGLLTLGSAAAAVALSVSVIRLPLRVDVDHGGIGIVRRRGRLYLPWTEVSRIGVSGPGDPWLVLWPAGPVTDRLLRGSFRPHHGGYRVLRLAPWRRSAARAAEARAVRAALAWHAPHRVDPRL
jgi:eukaryotic-like serine/threonine-protein kinase